MMPVNCFYLLTESLKKKSKILTLKNPKYDNIKVVTKRQNNCKIL